MNKTISKKNIKLLKDERLDDLQYKNLHLIQNKNLYCFSSDAVLLCNFVKAKKTDIIVDLCSGSGVVGMLAQAKTGAQKLYLIEKQTELAEMSKRSFELNYIENAKVICADILHAPMLLGEGKIDVVCSNPPYYLQSQKKLSGNYKIDMAKFEIEISLDKLCEVASKLLKFGGKFYLINDARRIAEIIQTLKKYNLEPKVIEFVFSKDTEPSNVVLIQATKHGKPGAKVFYKKN